jgi:hypothetical protein
MGRNLSSLADKYGTIDNLKGAAQVASMYQPTPLQSAPSGRIEVGEAPSPEAYAKFQQAYTQIPKRREINFSLLG